MRDQHRRRRDDPDQVEIIVASLRKVTKKHLAGRPSKGNESRVLSPGLSTVHEISDTFSTKVPAPSTVATLSATH